MSLLSMKSVKKSFDGVEILKDISLEVGEGEILSIIGAVPHCLKVWMTVNLATVEIRFVKVCPENLFMKVLQL